VGARGAAVGGWEDPATALASFDEGERPVRRSEPCGVGAAQWLSADEPPAMRSSGAASPTYAHSGAQGEPLNRRAKRSLAVCKPSHGFHVQALLPEWLPS